MQIHPLLSAKMSRDKRDVLPVIIYSRHTIYEIRDTIAENYGQIKYELPFINAVAVELSREKINTVSKSSLIRMITDDAIVSKAGGETGAGYSDSEASLAASTYSCLPPGAPLLPSCYLNYPGAPDDGRLPDRFGPAQDGLAAAGCGLLKKAQLADCEQPLPAELAAELLGPESAAGTTAGQALDRFQPLPHHPLYHLKRGQGVSVAVIDTGVAPHYDLIYPRNRIVGFHDFINHQKEPYDDDGHGTHVAGIIAGNGFTSRKYVGSAPCAGIVGLKALDQNGNGTTSDILAAMQWCINNRRLFNIRVINLSLGVSSTTDYEDDPLIKGANAAIASGISVVAAAGNSGPGRSTINSPGSSPHVLTVGACDLSQARDRGIVCVADFSSRGPTSLGLTKPDLLAPGVDIMSLNNLDAKGYAVQSGTSMATPVVSGAAACLYAQRPRLTPRQVKQLLIDSTLPVNEEHPNAQGRGVLNYEIFFEL